MQLILRAAKHFILASILLFLHFPNLHAGTGWCHPVNGTIPYIFNFTKNINDPNQNQTGYLFNNIYTWGSTVPSPVTCDCKAGEGDGATYFKTETSLPIARQDGSTVWYTVNEYLQASAKAYIGGLTNSYVPVPWDNATNGASGDSYIQCDGKVSAYANTGASGKISLYIVKPFVGESNFSVKLFDVYRSNNKGSFGGPPVSTVYITGMIIVPQNCIIDTGSIVSVDFGNIPTSAFQTAGVKAINVLPVKKDVNIQCTNIAAQANLTLRLESEKVSGNSLVSDNPDVGFNIEDSTGKPLTPNDINRFIPFTLDMTGKSTITLIIYPVSITGNKPTSGPVTSLGYLRVDFA
ncbi:fimbrial protein (plasmid) [Enterobacter asburiae]|uniref:fimbrial protein n=1 Tax=Enterobacter TaxID=547 RepID=UPI002A7EF95D|nr:MULTISPECIES: fimbrial protein [unclassified Enterobacter]